MDADVVEVGRAAGGGEAGTAGEAQGIADQAIFPTSAQGVVFVRAPWGDRKRGEQKTPKQQEFHVHNRLMGDEGASVGVGG